MKLQSVIGKTIEIKDSKIILDSIEYGIKFDTEVVQFLSKDGKYQIEFVTVTYYMDSIMIKIVPFAEYDCVILIRTIDHDMPYLVKV